MAITPLGVRKNKEEQNVSTDERRIPSAPIGNILWKCPECNTFNAAEAPTCKKCGAAKVITEDIAGATYKPIEESERRNQDKKFS